MMRRAKAAAYLDITEAAFEREINAGRLPMPVMLGGHERWSKTQMDDAIDRITGEAIPDYRANSNFYLRNPELVR